MLLPWARSGECPSAQLDIIKERERNSDVEMARAVELFMISKSVINLDKNSRDRLKVLRLSGKASAALCQCGDVMVQIGIR